MNKFIFPQTHLKEIREYMNQNKIKHGPFIKVVNNKKYKYVCEVINRLDFESIKVGLYGIIEFPKEGEKYYKPGYININE